jgi:hypothetical protein
MSTGTKENPMSRRRLAPLLLAAAALASPAHAGAPFPWVGVHVVQADLTACNPVTIDGAITLNANIPDDGRTYEWSFTLEATDGTNVGVASGGPAPLTTTAGDVLLENTGSLPLGAGTPVTLGNTYTYTYTARTSVDGALILVSTISGTCTAGTPTALIDDRLAPPACGPRLATCTPLYLPKAKLKLSDGGVQPEKSKLTFAASGAPADLAHFQDPTLAVGVGGATNATCIYDAMDTLIFAVGVDSARLDDRGRPMWKRTESAAKAVNRYRDPSGSQGFVRSMAQTAGAKAKVALAARGMPAAAGAFTESALLVQQRTVSPLGRVVTCTEVIFLGGEIAVDAAKGTVKAKIKTPACGPGCP